MTKFSHNGIATLVGYSYIYTEVTRYIRIDIIIVSAVHHAFVQSSRLFVKAYVGICNEYVYIALLVK